MRNAAASPRSSHGAGLGGCGDPLGMGRGGWRGGGGRSDARVCECVRARAWVCMRVRARACAGACDHEHPRAPCAHACPCAGAAVGCPRPPPLPPPPPLQRGLTAPWGGGGSATSASSCLLPWKPSALRALEACGCGRGERGCCGRKGPRQGHGSVGTSRLRGDAVRPRGCDSSAGTSRLRGDVAVLLGLRQLTAPVSVPPAAPVGWG